MVNVIIEKFKQSSVFGAYQRCWHNRKHLQCMMEIICDLPTNSPVAHEAAAVVYNELYGKEVAA